MSARINIFQLNARNALRKAPLKYGLYTLFDRHGKPIYSGIAERETLRERLLNHIQSKDAGLEGACFFCIERVQETRKMDHLVSHIDTKLSETAEGKDAKSKADRAASQLMAIDGVLYSAYMN
jgi:hypothetical protein